jgi:hypothetical protein
MPRARAAATAGKPLPDPHAQPAVYPGSRAMSGPASGYTVNQSSCKLLGTSRSTSTGMRFARRPSAMSGRSTLPTLRVTSISVHLRRPGPSHLARRWTKAWSRAAHFVFPTDARGHLQVEIRVVDPCLAEPKPRAVGVVLIHGPSLANPLHSRDENRCDRQAGGARAHVRAACARRVHKRGKRTCSVSDLGPTFNI